MRDSTLYITNCCNFKFIGMNHSPVDADGIRCRHCENNYSHRSTCIEGHDKVRYFVADKGDAWICVRCRSQVGNCSKDGSMLPQEKVEELVEYALKMREEWEIRDRRLGRKKDE